MKNALKHFGKRAENIAPHLLCGSKIYAVFSRYISYKPLAYTPSVPNYLSVSKKVNVPN
jgi:hypothetical protein